MAQAIACTAYFGSNAGRGWSETYHLALPSPTPSLIPILGAFLGLMNDFRRPLLGKDRYLKGLKVSCPTPTGAIQSVPFRYSPFLYPGNQRAGCAPYLAAMCRMGEVSGTEFAPIFLRGFWDDIEQNEQIDFTTAAGAAWKALLDQFIPQLISGRYGWLGQDEIGTSRGKVTNYTLNVDGTITFVIENTAGGPTPPVGSVQEFRVARLNGSDSPLNKSMPVTVVDATHVKTLKRIAAGAFVTAGTYVIPQQTFVQYTGVLYTILAKKGEGRPTNQSPARRKARAQF
jgi:hypothetical protein